MESPPATRREKPVSEAPFTTRVVAVRPMSLISGYGHHTLHPVIEILNFRGRL